MALLLGAGAAALTAWQQAVVAGVFELCLVGVMVIYELLGHGLSQQPIPHDIEPRSQKAHSAAEEARAVPVSQSSNVRPSPRRKAATAAGGVKGFIRDQVFPNDGSRVEMQALMQDYRAWCSQMGVAPIDLSEFLDEIEKVCSKLGIDIEVGDDQRVYCVGVRLGNQVQQLPAAVH